MRRNVRTETEASAGTKEGVGRYVLGVGLILVIVAFAIAGFLIL